MRLKIIYNFIEKFDVLETAKKKYEFSTAPCRAQQFSFTIKPRVSVSSLSSVDGTRVIVIFHYNEIIDKKLSVKLN